MPVDREALRSQVAFAVLPSAHLKAASTFPQEKVPAVVEQSLA